MTGNDIEGMSRIVSEIAKNDFRLSIGNYIHEATMQEESLCEGVAAWNRWKNLKKDYLEADKEMEEILSRCNA